MARTLPPMMQVMKDIGGVEFPESLIKFSEEEKKEPVAVSPNGGRVPSTTPRGKDGSSGAT
jgi:flotillin